MAFQPLFAKKQIDAISTPTSLSFTAYFDADKLEKINITNLLSNAARTLAHGPSTWK